MYLGRTPAGPPGTRAFTSVVTSTQEAFVQSWTLPALGGRAQRSLFTQLLLSRWWVSGGRACLSLAETESWMNGRVRPKASSCPVTPPHLSRCWIPWESYSGSRAVRISLTLGTVVTSLQGTELGGEAAHWAGTRLTASRLCAGAQRHGVPSLPPRLVSHRWEQRGSVSAEREMETQRHWSLAQSHTVLTCCGVCTQVCGPGTGQEEAGGLGARRRDCDGHCEVGPSKGLGVYAPAWETWVVGELSLHFIEG